MRLGFSGSRRGTTPAQRAVIMCALAAATELHHGDCVGADVDAYQLAVMVDVCKIVSHPPTVERWRAYTLCHEVRPPAPYRQRDAEIVASTDQLLAAPSGAEHDKTQRRSGTWLTVRLAVRTGKPVLVVYPDGTEERR